uniref:RING-type domain-containing protein n=1 Tax=Strigamia maritima TaxID=126957 RepID=T1IUN0_STRMM
MAESDPDGGGFHSRSDSPVNLSSEHLELDLEDLDDTEYEIPPVENPPTLESILNEPDAEFDSDEEIGTNSTVIVVSIRPKLKVVFTYGLKAKSNTLPLISWQYVIIQVEPCVKIIDPVFAFGREDVLYFFQVSVKEKLRNISFIMLKKMELNYNLLNFSWLNPRTIIILDTAEQVRLVDVRTEETIEIVDLSDVQLVYASSHFKGLSTGGNVSEAMVCAADQACYQSITSFNGQILLLGIKSVHLLTLRSWKEDRVNAGMPTAMAAGSLLVIGTAHGIILVFDAKQVMKCCLGTAATGAQYGSVSSLSLNYDCSRLLCGFAKGTITMWDLTSGKLLRTISDAHPMGTAVLHIKMCNLLGSHMEYVISKSSVDSLRVDILNDYYQDVIPSSIDYHLLLEQTFQELEINGIKRAALIPDFIDSLFNKVYESFRTHAITREIFLEALEPRILINRFESIPIPPTVVSDFVDHYAAKEEFEALQACIAHMDISTMDLHKVLTICWAQNLYDAIFHINNKAMGDYVGPLVEFLDLLSQSLKAGKQLTDNQITLGNKILVYSSCCLAGRAYPIGDIEPGKAFSVKEQVFKCLMSKHLSNRKPSDKHYPHLRILLHFDTREFLNVLSLAFEEREFDQMSGIWSRQEVIDILMQIMHHSQDFSPTQVGYLFTFLARQMAKHETIVVNRNLFEQVVEYLTNTSDESRKEERQQALLELFATGGLKFYDEEKLLQQAEKAQFFQVCEVLYMKRREFNRLLGCFLLDPTRKLQVFSFTRNLIECDELSETEKQVMQLEVLTNIEELIEIDNSKTAQLLLDCFPNTIPNVIECLGKDSKTLYQFLLGLFEYQDNIEIEAKTKNRTVDLFIDYQLAETLIGLMCRFDPKNVHKFIRDRDDYRLEETLEIVFNSKIMDACAYLLAKLGRTVEAFKILIESFNQCVLELMNRLMVGSDINESPTNAIWLNLESNLLNMIQFCQRNSGRMAEDEREAVWFELLDTLMTPQRNVDSQLVPIYFRESKETIRHLLNSMMGYIKLPSIIQKIIEDPSYNIQNFAEIRDLLLGLLDTYNYEKTLLETTSHLLNGDLHKQLQQLCKAANRGFAVHENICNLCNQGYNKSGDTELDSIVLFRCGHGYHTSCLLTIETLQAGNQGGEQFACPICQRHKKKEEMSKRRISVRQTPSETEDEGQNAVKRDQTHAKPKVHLEPQQILALDKLRKLYQTTTRAPMLSMLSKKDNRPYCSKSSILQDVNFALKLAPPPMKSASNIVI